jgi:hypothetical protein
MLVGFLSMKYSLVERKEMVKGALGEEYKSITQIKCAYDL